MGPLQGKRFEALDSLRGICALLVVCFHARILTSFAELKFFRNAAFFVEFFFVLSGFVMLHTYGNKIFNKDKFKDYLTSRFFRLYPMHLLVLAFVIFLEFLKLYGQKKGFDFNNAAFTAFADPVYILPNLLLVHAWISEPAALSFNTPSWSISVEFYIYIIFGLILFWGAKAKKLLFATILVTAFVLLLIDAPVLTHQAIRGLLCFFTGCFSYMIYSKFSSVKSNRTLFTALELLLVILIVGILVSGLSFNYKSIAATLTFSATIIVFAMEAGYISGLFKKRFFTYLGHLSYSIYITHYIVCFLFVAAAIVLSKLTGNNFTVVDNSTAVPTRFITTHSVVLDQLVLLILLSVIILISSFTYKYVELKGIELGKKFRSRNQPVVRGADVLK